MPSRTLLLALVADGITGTALAFVGLPDLIALPWWQTFEILGYAMISCLVVNDALRVVMIRWCVPLGATGPSTTG